MIAKFAKHLFLFEELVKRDFKQKYKGTVIGMAWSVLSPLLNLLVLRLVFTQFFGRNMEHYTTYLFAGTVFFSFFKEATKGGMNALTSNASIFTKINVPKYLFLLSKNVSAVINFGILALVVFWLVRGLNKLTELGKKKEAEAAAAEPPAPPAPSAEEVLLTEIRDLLKNK